MYNFGRLSKIILGGTILAVTLCVLGAPAHAFVVPSTNSANFANQAVGTASAPLNITLTNSSSRPTTIVSASLSTAAFAFSGLSLPMTLASGQSVVVTVTFAPLAPVPYFGALVILRDFGSPAVVRLSGTGVSAQGGQPGQPGQPGQGAASFLSANVTALSFVNASVSGSSVQNVTFTNTGSSNITISGVSVSGAGFSLGGSTTGSVTSTGVILSPGQTSTATVTFAPAASGNVTGSIVITSDAANSPTVIVLSGTAGASAPAQTGSSVDLSWMPSTSDIVGYKAYSSTVSGGPYTVLTATPVPMTSYVDSTVESGQTYFYVVTAVDSNNEESAFSNEASITIH